MPIRSGLIALAISFFALLGIPSAAVAQLATVVASCPPVRTVLYPVGTQALISVDVNGTLCSAASVSASITGFSPASTGTPISVTTSNSTGTLPAGAVVVASNVGTTNIAYCKLGASATTSDQPIAPNGGWFAFTLGAATQLTCITSTSTTTVNMVGGAGLPTGTGGGGGSGSGGGAVTIADGADVTQGALADAACATDNGTCSEIALTKRGNQRLTTLNTTLGSPFQAGGSIGNTSFIATQATAANLNATVVGTGTFATQSAVTAASGAFASGSFASGSHASGSFASGAFASGSVASGAYASGALASGSIASGAMVDLVASQTPIAAATATATKGLLAGGQYDSTQKTLTNGQQAAYSMSVRGAMMVSTGADTFTVTGSGGVFPVATWAGGTLGAMANYGTSPGAVLVPGVNAFITNVNANGQATMANSSPVVLASNQTSIPITVASGGIASGAVASGAFASGAVASGAYASGALASGAVVDITNLSTPITPATATATKGVLLGGQYNSTQATFTNGQQGAIQISSRGEAKMNLCDAAANARCVNVDTNNNAGVVLPAETTKVLGTLRVQGNVGGVLDAVIGAAAPANSMALASLGSGATGGLLARNITCDNHTFKHITSATDTVAVQGVASQTIYICGWRSRAAGTATWYLENTASANNNCSSTLTQLTGLASEVVNSGEVAYNPIWGGLKNTSGQGLCINSTGTGGVDVDIWYTQF